MTFKKLLLSTALFATLGATSAMADGLTANVGLTTDYTFRGISRTDEEPAIQGGFDYQDPSGLHAGVWASNIDTNVPSDGSIEMDVYGGYGAEIGAFNYDVGGIYYAFPGSDSDYAFFELYAAMGYDFGFMALNGGINYSPDYFGETGTGVYYSGGVNVPLPHSFSASAHVGYQTIDDTDDYIDWSLGLGYDYMDFDFGLTYIDTDLSQSDLDESRLVLSVSRQF